MKCKERGRVKPAIASCLKRDGLNSVISWFQIYLRELISNASDALDKIRLLSLTDKSVLDTTEELSIKIKVTYY
jgi:hypothetical protein